MEIVESSRIVELVLRQKMPSNFHESLVSGVRLCMYFIGLFPLRRRPKYRSGRPEHYETNIQSFLQAAGTILSPNSLFSVDDLLMGSVEGLHRVARTIQALASASGRTFPPSFTPTFMPPPPVRNPPPVLTIQASDTMSVESSGSSTDWCRVDSMSMSSPQQQAFSPLSPRSSWVRVSRYEGMGEGGGL